MAVDFTKVPIGTKVETVYGPGEIIGIDPETNYCVRVRLLKGYIDTYLCDGRRYRDDNRPSLFLSPFDWPTQEQPLPDLAVDTPVMVRVRGDRPWQRRHFCRWEDGKCVAFTDGFSSWSTKTISRWEEWRLPTEAELKGETNE